MAYVAIGCVAVASDPSFHNVESNFNNLCTQHWPVHPPMLQVSLRKTSMTDMHIEAQQVFGWYSCGNGAKQEGIERRGWRVYRTWVDEWIIWASNWHYNAHATVIHRNAHTHSIRIYSTYVCTKQKTHAKSSHNNPDIVTSRVGTLPVHCPWTGMFLYIAPQLEAPAEKYTTISE